MRVICVILCLIISITAYAESILWLKTHSSTSLEKDQEWLLSATTEEGEDLEDDVEEIACDIADPEDSVTFIDATLMMEGIEGMGAIDPIIVVEETEATPLEILMDSSTTDEMQEDEGLGDGVEDGVEHTAPEDGVDEIGSQTNP